MTEDYNCKLCGAKYEDEDELNVHKREDHSEFTEMYGEEERKQVGISPVTGLPAYKDVDDADEIDQQEDKPTQSHDDWKEDLDSMRDQYSTEEVLKRATEQDEEETVKVKKWWGDVSDDEKDETINVKKYWGKKEGEEDVDEGEGNAEDYASHDNYKDYEYLIHLI